ncbi:MAG: hypothetical protein KDC45_10880 [Bacteroidetes bacterium]|nr:hypothetical protein [Bacteroidota bacterium]
MKPIPIVVVFLSVLLYSCEENSRSIHSKKELDQIVNEQARAMILSGLGRFNNAGNFTSVSAGGPVSRWFWFPWGYGGGYGGGVAAGVVSSTPVDTSYYDPATGYWTFQYDYDGYSGRMRYRFDPHDNDGYPTSETDQYEFESTFSGRFDDPFTGIGYAFEGVSDYSVSGFKDWNDSSKNGELVFNGNSESSYSQFFAPDTAVHFTYLEMTDDVRLRQQDCFPYHGTSEYSMIQDATPDTFSWRYESGWTEVDSTSGDTVYYDPTYTISYEDFSFIGRTVFTEKGIHYVIDGEDYFYEVECGNNSPLGLGRRASSMGNIPKKER